jgi:hypothetical protein
MPRYQTRTGDSVLPGKPTHRCLMLLLMIMVVSCSSPGPPAATETVSEVTWSRIALPESVAASSLAAAANNLLVGGRGFGAPFSTDLPDRS